MSKQKFNYDTPTISYDFDGVLHGSVYKDVRFNHPDPNKRRQTYHPLDYSRLVEGDLVIDKKNRITRLIKMPDKKYLSYLIRDEKTNKHYQVDPKTFRTYHKYVELEPYEKNIKKLKKQSGSYQIIVVSARGEYDVIKRFLKKHDLEKYITKIFITRGKSKIGLLKRFQNLWKHYEDSPQYYEDLIKEGIRVMKVPPMKGVKVSEHEECDEGLSEMNSYMRFKNVAHAGNLLEHSIWTYRALLDIWNEKEWVPEYIKEVVYDVKKIDDNFNPIFGTLAKYHDIGKMDLYYTRYIKETHPIIGHDCIIKWLVKNGHYKVLPEELKKYYCDDNMYFQVEKVLKCIEKEHTDNPYYVMFLLAMVSKYHYSLGFLNMDKKMAYKEFTDNFIKDMMSWSGINKLDIYITFGYLLMICIADVKGTRPIKKQDHHKDKIDINDYLDSKEISLWDKYNYDDENGNIAILIEDLWYNMGIYTGMKKLDKNIDQTKISIYKVTDSDIKKEIDELKEKYDITDEMINEYNKGQKELEKFGKYKPLTLDDMKELEFEDSIISQKFMFIKIKKQEESKDDGSSSDQELSGLSSSDDDSEIEIIEIIKEKEEKKEKEEECNVTGLKWIGNSCYLDSVLLALFASPSKFIDDFIINADLKENNMEVCTKDNSIKDLETRKLIQKELQRLAIHIRTGKEIDQCVDFRKVIRNCKDLRTYGDTRQKDAGEFLGYVLSVFDINVAEKHVITYATNNTEDDFENISKEDIVKTSHIIDKKASIIWFVSSIELNTYDEVNIKNLLELKEEAIFDDTNLFKYKDQTYKRRLSKTVLYDTPHLIFRTQRKNPIDNSFVKTIVNPEEYIDLNEKLFELTSIVTHSGGTKGGHYTCYFKCNDDWYYHDDMLGVASHSRQAQAHSRRAMMSSEKRTIKIGNFETMLNKKRPNPKTNGTLYYYNRMD